MSKLPKVLLVSKDRRYVYETGFKLADHGVEAFDARNPLEALQRIRDELSDLALIVTDYRMDYMRAPAFIEAFRQGSFVDIAHAYRLIPIVVRINLLHDGTEAERAQFETDMVEYGATGLLPLSGHVDFIASLASESQNTA